MRRAIWAVFGMLVAFAPGGASAQADSFAEFRVPENGYRIWTLDASGTESWHRETGPIYYEMNTSLGGATSTRWRSWQENDTRSGSLDLTLGWTGHRSHDWSYYGASFASSSDRSEYRSRSTSESARGTTSQLWYATSLPLHLRADASALLAAGQSWNSSAYLRPEYPALLLSSEYSHALRSSDVESSVRVTAGVGRTRNATGLYEARVLQRRLLASGLILRPLRPVGLGRLANLFYSMNSLLTTSDRPAFEVWSSIERILRDDGAFSDSGAGMGALARLTEPYVGSASSKLVSRAGLPLVPFQRLSGWSLDAGFETHDRRSRSRERSRDISRTDSLGTSLSRFESASTITRSGTEDEFDVVFSGEVHRPLGSGLQADATGSDLLPLRRLRSGFDLDLTADVSWCVLDRWLVTLGARHHKGVRRDERHRTLYDFRRTELSGELEYFLTNRVSLHAETSQMWDHDGARSDGFISIRNGDAYGDVRLGVTYRFTGSARIADIFPAGHGR